jgi:hypothetical protein
MMRGSRMMAVLVVIGVLAPLGLFTLVGPGALASGATTAAVTRPFIEWNCVNGKVKPSTIILACGDGNAVAEQLRWTQWKSARAIGTGILRQNDCTPDCADGVFSNYPARFMLTETTPVGHVKFFTRVTITFSGKDPVGKKTESVKDCWDTPPTPDQPECPANLQGAG